MAVGDLSFELENEVLEDVDEGVINMLEHDSRANYQDGRQRRDDLNQWWIEHYVDRT
jgi:hypothetical protein